MILTFYFTDFFNINLIFVFIILVGSQYLRIFFYFFKLLLSSFASFHVNRNKKVEWIVKSFTATEIILM